MRFRSLADDPHCEALVGPKADGERCAFPAPAHAKHVFHGASVTPNTLSQDEARRLNVKTFEGVLFIRPKLVVISRLLSVGCWCCAGIFRRPKLVIRN
jgi:hypothetical protein